MFCVLHSCPVHLHSYRVVFWTSQTMMDTAWRASAYFGLKSDWVCRVKQPTTPEIVGLPIDKVYCQFSILTPEWLTTFGMKLIAAKYRIFITYKQDVNKCFVLFLANAAILQAVDNAGRVCWRPPRHASLHTVYPAEILGGKNPWFQSSWVTERTESLFPSG